MQPFIKRSFPSQKKTTAQKTKKWQEECLESAILLATYNHTGKIRDSKANMKANYNLYDGIMNPDDIEKTVNPWGLDASSFPASMECYPIASNKINVLLGEEAKRRFDWRLRVTNDDAVSEKEKFVKDTVLKMLTEASTQENLDEAQAQQIAQDVQRWATYEAQDMRERIGTQILNHLWQEQKLKLTFNNGFKDALIAGEEVYCADIVGGKPILRRVDPLSLYTVGMANTPYIDDADIIVEDTYQSIGWVIDNYYDYLSPSQIDQLEGGTSREQKPRMLVNYPDESSAFLRYADEAFDDSIEVGSGTSYDIDGNIRVSRAVWKSMRKVGILTFIDEETGEEVSMLVPDVYKPNPELGETVEWLWINEWWEGTKIGKDIYVKLQPRPVQFRRMDNLSLSGSGYVGTVYNTNNNKGNSLMNKMKPYVYMYNKLFYRLSKEISKYKGPMVELDLSKKPGSWDIDKWMYYAEEMGYLVIDSFNEGVKGMAQGKLAGNFNTTGKVMNPELGNFIGQTVELLRFIDEALGLAVGITRQREGSIDSRETVGGIERSVTQSSHATEELFLTHDFTKLRALEVLLETGKYAYLNDNKVAQYIMDADLAQYIYTIDGEMFNEADYGLVMTDSTTHTELRNTLIQLAHAGIQNQMLNFSTFMDIYMTPSIADTRRKIERAEQEMQQKQVQQQEAQQEHEAKMLEMEIENREDIQAHQLEIEQLKSDTQIEVKLLEIEAKANLEGSKETPVEDNSFDKEKFLKEYTLKERDLAEKKRQALVKEKQKDEEIEIKRKIANKPKPTSK
jgi:hypothetical protein